jgi:alkylation response protein AidB-like acyl-CoA dehydrogenase
VLTVRETEEEQRYRADIAAWADTHLPLRLRWRADHESLLEIDRLLAAHDLLAPAWPAEYGGRDLSPSLQLVLDDALGQLGVQRAKAPSHQGVDNLGPTLIRHGRADQRRFFLPRILSTEHLWCQGFSEPDAGSDLASLRTSARRDGTEFVVNGSKVWTSGAEHAGWMYALVRTGTTEERHRGLTFLLLEMPTAGVTWRPIEQITGERDFCQVFFDDARVPVANVVGDIGAGWSVALTLLDFERLSGRHRLQSFRRECEALAALIAAAPADRQDGLVVGLGRCVAEIEGMAALAMRAESLHQAGQPPAALPSVNKLWWPLAHQRLVEFAWKTANALRLDDGTWYRAWLAARAESIYGGSRQIQRNILAERFLGLPKSS